MSTYSFSSFRRYVIADDDDPVEKWTVGTQFAWGPVESAQVCSTCQNTGGTCGYDTEDNSLLFFCGDNAYKSTCDDLKLSGDRTGIIVGATVTMTFIWALACIACYLFCQSSYRWRMFGKRMQLRLDGINEAPIEFPYGALAAATNSFKTEVHGRGGFGKVYKGLLADGNEVAVKVLDGSTSSSHGQLMNEVATIGNIYHINVARLFGFCFPKSRRILVFEYVCNGSLDKYLFPDEKSYIFVYFVWKQRFDIALGIARGLKYMHEECRKFIIHFVI
ncbi:hypothetical protein L7F22_018363 [Adiantum nelumboides]|nr:hypothetical protein [Adiantum nelumboides]